MYRNHKHNIYYIVPESNIYVTTQLVFIMVRKDLTNSKTLSVDGVSQDLLILIVQRNKKKCIIFFINNLNVDEILYKHKM